MNKTTTSNIQIISLFLFLFISIGTTNSIAQKKRFESDDFFSDVKVSKNVVYGANIPFLKIRKENILMDVYEPNDDIAQKRPLIILVHAGSFLDTNVIGAFNPNKPLGTKEDNWIVEAATRLAKKGYVVVSMDHRVGWQFSASTQEELGRSIFRAVWRGMNDLKACVRFFRHDAANANIFKIDENRIAAGGSSSGGYLPIHSQVLNKPSELVLEKFLDSQGKSFIDTMDVDQGNFDGVVVGKNESGSSLTVDHLKYSYKLNAILSFGGAVGTPEFIEAGDPVIIATHGTLDKSTPYKTTVVRTAIGDRPIIEVSGSHDMIKRSTEIGNQKILIDAGFNDSPYPGLKPFNNMGFEPFSWYRNSNTTRIDSAKVYMDSLINFISPRLFLALNLKSFSNIDIDQTILKAELYPNPTFSSTKLTLSTYGKYSVEVFDILGRNIIHQDFEGQEIVLDNAKWDKGMYILKVIDSNGKEIRQRLVKN